MIECKIITGFPFSEYNRLKNAIEQESDNNSLVFDDSFLEWEKTEENYKNLGDVEASAKENEISTIFLVGCLYSRHLTFFEDVENFEVSVTVVHVPPKKFLNRFEQHLETYSVPFFDRANKKWPYYERNLKKSPFDYITQFYYDFEDQLSEIQGFHFNEGKLNEEDFVESVLYDFLFEYDNENEFYDLITREYKENKFSPDVKRTVKEFSDDNVKLLIASFLLPEEFNLFYKQSQTLLRSFDKHLSNIDITLRVHLDLSDFYVNWDRSKLDKEILYANFYDLEESFDVYCDTDFSCFDDIHGCNDIRRQAVRKFSNEVDCFSWLDPDTVFPTDIFYIYEKILPRINKNYNLYGITPQIFRPETGYLQPLSANSDFSYEKPASENIHRLNETKKSLKRIEDDFRVNGAFSILSSRLLKMTDIPNELGHYGNDDIYVNECINLINNLQVNSKVALFLVKNLVTYQDEDWRSNDSLTSFVHKKLNENTASGENHKKTQSVLDQLYSNFKANFYRN